MIIWLWLCYNCVIITYNCIFVSGSHKKPSSTAKQSFINFFCHLINSLRPDDPRIHHWPRSSLVQAMACCLFFARLLRKPILNCGKLDFYGQWDSDNWINLQLSWKCDRTFRLQNDDFSQAYVCCKWDLSTCAAHKARYAGLECMCYKIQTNKQTKNKQKIQKHNENVIDNAGVKTFSEEILD